jgi:hypothetical protein
MSLVGTTRTWRSGPTTSAVGAGTDVPFKRADFRVWTQLGHAELQLEAEIIQKVLT